MIARQRSNKSIGTFATTTLALLTSNKRCFVTAFSSSSSSSSSNNKTIVLDNMLSSSHSPYLRLEHITTPVGSTQDEARRLLQQQPTLLLPSEDKNNNKNTRSFLAVLADTQLNGRGTQGRYWEGRQEGNLYLTICVPYDQIPVQITLLPLQIAVLVAERVSKLLAACYSSRHSSESTTTTTATTTHFPPLPKTTVKWPNDVLINDKKVSGTLMESEIVNGVTWLLIGIGVNIEYAPDLSQSPGTSARASTCLQEYCGRQTDHEKESRVVLPPNTAYLFGRDLANALVEWVMDESNTVTEKQRREQLVIQNWKSYVEFGTQYQIRGTVEEEESGSHVGDVVTSVDIQNDGQLRVRGSDGKERLLIADYLF
jgi:BirA family biotin operon repressor/biotin-[acetyl-CoA-carboxylase] ligase